MRALWTAFLVVSLLVSAPTVADEAAIVKVIETQAAAWNAGDIDGFMAHYWKSDQLTFSSGGETTRGWEDTKARYDRRYPTPEAMGHLTLDQFEVYPLGETAALVLGRWGLEREADAPGGNFSLVFRRIDDRWVIVHDHTSVGDED
jgi:beta-aspartyl-peptidase (threonine type)